MEQKISIWLSQAHPNFSEGVALYFAVGNSLVTKHKLLQGDTPENRALLRKSLAEIVPNILPQPNTGEIVASAIQQQENTSEHKTALVAALRQEAFNSWKELMNKRAVLFKLCRHEMWEEENSPERVALRGKLALEIIAFNRKEVNRAFEAVAYAEEHGKPPTHPEDITNEEDEYAHLPDIALKATIDNIRKNLSKIRKREQTPERMDLIKKHERNLEKLLARWHSSK